MKINKMSYFNEEQENEMMYLASLKPEDRCWCGWYLAGKCKTPTPCDPKDTLADRLKVTCSCGSYPHKPNAKINHRTNCILRKNKN